MHPIIQKVADILGIALADRNANDSWVWDGQTLATWSKYSSYDGIEERKRDFTDTWLLHEMGHWIVAKPWQRDLPEYGLAWGVAPNASEAYGPKDHYKNADGSLNDAAMTLAGGLILDKEEENNCEYFADWFVILTNDRLGLAWPAGYWSLPDEYIRNKTLLYSGLPGDWLAARSLVEAYLEETNFFAKVLEEV